VGLMCPSVGDELEFSSVCLITKENMVIGRCCLYGQRNEICNKLGFVISVSICVDESFF
jgi:hypothetical protein